MGWNDRLLDDPYKPYQSEKDRDDYEAWNDYISRCAAESGLTSQNLAPAQLTQLLTRTDAQAEEERSPLLSAQRQQPCYPATSGREETPSADQGSAQ